MSMTTEALPQGDLRLLETDLARELLASSIPARLVRGHRRHAACGPHVVRADREELVMVTYVAGPNIGIRHPAARVAALRANPVVAVTIDTDQFPAQSLTIRGPAE